MAKSKSPGCTTFLVFLAIIVAIAWVIHAHQASSATTSGGPPNGTPSAPCTTCSTFLNMDFANTVFGSIHVDLQAILPPKSLDLNPTDWTQVDVSVGRFSFSSNDPYFGCLAGVVPSIFADTIDPANFFVVFYKDCVAPLTGKTGGHIGAMKVEQPLSGGWAYFEFPNDNALCKTVQGETECMPNFCLSVNPSSISLDANTSSQAVTLRNCGSGNGDEWTVPSNGIMTSDNGNWLGVDTSSSTLQDNGGTQTINVSLVSSNLPGTSGSYTGSVTFQTVNCSAQTTVNVTLNV